MALAVTSFAGGPYLTLMPVFAEEVLGAGPQGYGGLMTAVGAGALCGAFVMHRLTGEVLRMAPAVAAMTFGVAIVAAGAGASGAGRPAGSSRKRWVSG